MDKRQWIAKVQEPSEQFLSLAMDVMMYCKYKIVNGVSFEGLTDILRKVKISLLKIIASQEFLKALSSNG